MNRANYEERARPLRVFAYVNAEKTPLYRSLMRIFMDAKASFALHLRVADIARELPKLSIQEIEAVVTQLCEWGNLEAHRDTSEVASVEDFYRPRYLYQLTGEGEAAERAIEVFYETVVQPGELQAAALEDILNELEEVARLGGEGVPDPGKVHRALSALSAHFERLTSRAQTFIRSLQRTIDLRGIEVEVFLAYKQTLIDYLERFIGELIVATTKIAENILRIEGKGVERLLVVAARRDMADALDQNDERHREARERWHRRWAGFSSWFLSDGERQSQAEVLRGLARSAIPDLLIAVAGINDRRATRSDRATDLQNLARWFAETDTDAEANRLWRAAFALAPARHLRIDEETLDWREDNPVSAQTSWLDAPPLLISPRLRKAGRHVAKGPAKGVIDCTQGKEDLAKMERDEAAQIVAAQARLATGRTMRLSEIGELDGSAFDLFLDLLGEALAAKAEENETVDAQSSDGALRIRLSPTGDSVRAVIRTHTGCFSGQDHFVTISSVFENSTMREEPSLP